MGESAIILKYSTLLLITVQTSSMVLLLRYSRRQTADPKDAYINSTAVFLSEFAKLIICLVVIAWNDSVPAIWSLLRDEVFGKPKESAKILIPALLYTMQNNLLFLALSNLDAATFQVTYQFKILTTALFSVTMLHRHLSVRQWLALLLLMIGVILVQWPTDAPVSKGGKESKFLGLTAVVISSFSSGFSGVYFEKLIKHNTQSLWTRNTQLAIISSIFALSAVCINDYTAVAEKGFFHGYTKATWSVVLLQAFGGLCVSLVMKYADNILKGFATTISIILSSVCSFYIFDDFLPNSLFYSGATFVVSSTLLYSL